MRLVYYSLSIDPEVPRPDLLQQLDASVTSLRKHNGTLPVLLFLFGDLPAAVGRRLADLAVSVVPCGSYTATLAALFPDGGEELASYPLLHKFLHFPTICSLAPRQVLYLDCDTLFFGDAERLFDAYATADCYAREEPTTRRSHYGYDPSYLDEDALERLARGLGIRPVAPFNLGVVLFNNGLWERLAPLGPLLLSYAWRFALWMADHPPHGAARAYGEAPGIELLRRKGSAPRRLGTIDQPLPYPSANRWIWDQLALWMTLGHLPDFSLDWLSSEHVLQNGELFDMTPHREWVVGHYFSQNMERVRVWLDAQNAAAGGRIACG